MQHETSRSRVLRSFSEIVANDTKIVFGYVGELLAASAFVSLLRAFFSFGAFLNCPDAKQDPRQFGKSFRGARELLSTYDTIHRNQLP
jgi:hypothetical protein